MTTSLPLLAAAALLAGLVGAPEGRPAAEPDGQRLARVSAPHPSVQRSKAGPVRHVAEHLTGSVAGHVVEHLAAVSRSEQRRVRAYWTPRRIAAAVPIDLSGAFGRTGHVAGDMSDDTAGETARGVAGGLGVPVPSARASRLAIGGREHARAERPGAVSSGTRWSAGGAVTRTTGRVFLTMSGVDFVCSASTIRSRNRDLVVTAGHCLKDGTGPWAENWTFVPGYQEGAKPYGTFTARRMFVAKQWSGKGDDSHDVGMVALNTHRGRHVADVVGFQEIGFNGPRGQQTYGFGFPADPPYDGRRLIYCAGRVRQDPYGGTQDQGLGCDMTAGSSGGPWLSGFDAAGGRGTVTSVSSFKYGNDHRTMYGPYFGASAKELYATAGRA
ncbi:peptidase [Microtetraspora sp. NBRC 13810]|uniref:trypsin-like serine peptidase n=1 Tax=Microtetraspora sp. NBRC 13810 TaxID=3030990 RepID=UPI0024A45C9A|nr:trypsin-like serine protease [Microtetraspora sp. NBRC 13810]GLW08411.1 peptidase [Microtetraspora sp. NBRC 13810]